MIMPFAGLLLILGVDPQLGVQPFECHQVDGDLVRQLARALLLEGLEPAVLTLELLRCGGQLTLEELGHLSGLPFAHPAVFLDVKGCQRVRHFGRALRVQSDVADLQSDGCRTPPVLVCAGELHMNIPAHPLHEGIGGDLTAHPRIEVEAIDQVAQA